MPARPLDADPPRAARLALVGAGRIGASHALVLTRRVPEADLVAVVDPRPGAAEAVAGPLGARPGTSYDELLAATGGDAVDAVVITAASPAHHELITTALAAGKHVFCEKPAGMSLSEIDEGRAGARRAERVLQVGFNRRYAAEFAGARRAVEEGHVGEVQLLRSLTRDPGSGPADPGAVPLGTIFTQTLIHDFDMLCWLNPGARPVDVLATADALVHPGERGRGHLDTAVVVIRFDNGAIATAEASFAAAYGYDVRGEVFGSRGMVTMGEGATSSLRLYDQRGRYAATARGDVELMLDAYTGELAAFARSVQAGVPDPEAPGADDAYRAFAIAEAAIASMRSGVREPVAADPTKGTTR